MLAVCLAQVGVAQDIEKGLAAYWKFDEGAGTKAEDFSGNDHHVASSGSPSWVQGRVEGAVELTIGDQFTVAGQLGSPESVSVSVWAKIEALGSKGGDIVNIADSVFVTQSLAGVGPFAGLQFHIRRSNGAYQTVNINQDFTGTGWHHFLGTFDADGKSLILYIDGEQVASISTTESITYDTSKGVTLGGNSSSALFDMIGSLDLVRVYDRYVTPEEVALLYEEGFASLRAHYKLDETSGTTAADSSGNDYDGTYVGAPALGESGVYESSTQFNEIGNSDSLEIPNTILDGLSNASVAFWLKTTRTGQQSILSAAGDTYQNEFLVFFTNSTTLSVYVQDKHVSWDIESIADDQWHHFAITMDSQTDLITVYKDGKLISAKTHGVAGRPLQVSAGGLMIAQEQDCVGGCFDTNQIFQGRLDEFHIYGRAITADEVADLYGLIGEWTFDEGTGTTAVDSSLKSNDAQFNTGTPTWVTGVRGYALEFDGTNDAITDFDFDPPAEGTISMWWRSDGPPLSRQRPWGLGGDFEMWQDPDGLVSMDVSTDGFQGGFITTVPLYSPGRWYHVAVQWDSDDDTYAIYLDGKLHKSGTSTRALNKQAANRLSFGTRTGSSQRFSGALDDFRIYNRKLSPNAIAELYGLVGHWKLDELTGFTATDSSPRENHASHSGGVNVGDMGPYPGVGSVAAEYDGIDDVTRTTADFDPPATGAVAFWMRGGGLKSQRQRLFGVSNDWEIRQEPDGTLKFDLGASPFVGSEVFSTAEPLADDGRWYHVAANFNDVDNTFEVYVDGQLQAAGVNSRDLLPQAAGILSIGTRTGSGENWEGAMYDLRIYDRNLSHAEVAELYGLVGYWKLDETSGSIAADSSGAQHHGDLLPGVTLANPGRVDEAANFDGAGYAYINPTQTLDMDDSLAMVAWIQPNSNSAIQHILNKEGEYEIAIFPDGTLRWALANTSPGWAWHNTGQVVPFGSWSHVAVVYDRGVVASYVNGAEIDVYYGSGSIGDAHTSQNSLQIGAREAYTNLRFFGLLDDVRLYNRPIGPQEVLDVFDEGNAAGIRIIRWVEVR